MLCIIHSLWLPYSLSLLRKSSKRVVKLSVAPLHSALQTIYSEINLLFKMNEGKPHGLKRKIEAILANEKGKSIEEAQWILLLCKTDKK